ncbi:MAG: hypothetical protein QF489_06755 [Planctomycetota bacterium]|jgi:hypothetical protein|nr:hypothetical protein [Planctomycetota bacterium]
MQKRLLVIGICAVLVAVAYLAPGVMNLLFDALDLAFGWAGPFVMVTLVSALVGMLFIMAFPHVSSQDGIKAVKDRIKFNLLAIRLFQDDLGTVFRSTGKTLSWNFGYLGLNMLPMVVLAVPFMIVWFQLNALYAYQPLEVGDEQMVVVELNEGVAPSAVDVVVPDGVEMSHRVNLADTAAPRILLRLRPTTEGAHELVLKNGGEEVLKTIEVGTDPKRLARLTTATPLAKFAAAKDPIVYFGDPVLPGDSFLQTITVDYPARPLGFMGGGEISIMLWFIVVSMAVGFGLKGFFGVEI